MDRLFTYDGAIEKALTVDHSVVGQIIEVLRTELRQVLPELKERICEQPNDWIGGRESIPCPVCEENVKPTCHACKGTGRTREWPLHHGWGTWVRNCIRQAGFLDDLTPDGNWDDYYVGLVQLAVEEEYGAVLGGDGGNVFGAKRLRQTGS